MLFCYVNSTIREMKTSIQICFFFLFIVKSNCLFLSLIAQTQLLFTFRDAVLLSFHRFFFSKVYFVSQSLDIFLWILTTILRKKFLLSWLKHTLRCSVWLAISNLHSLRFCRNFVLFRKWEGEGRGLFIKRTNFCLPKSMLGLFTFSS